MLAALSGWCRAAAAAAWIVLLGAAAGAAADAPQITSFELRLDDDGLLLDYTANFELSRGVEDALNKGVPLFFVAEAEVYQSRWYWRDRRVAHATRVWRVVYQPLTATYRVTFGGLAQSYASPAEALAAMRRGVRWKIADAGQVDADKSHYVEFSLRLDTSLLPRPMQIGVSGQADWALAAERRRRLN